MGSDIILSFDLHVFLYRTYAGFFFKTVCPFDCSLLLRYTCLALVSTELQTNPDNQGDDKGMKSQALLQRLMTDGPSSQMNVPIHTVGHRLPIYAL